MFYVASASKLDVSYCLHLAKGSPVMKAFQYYATSTSGLRGEVHMNLQLYLQDIVRIVGFCEFCGSKWTLIVLYACSSIVLRCGSYWKLVHTAYTQQQLHYNVDQVKSAVTTL